MSASIEEFDIIERYFAGKIACAHPNVVTEVRVTIAASSRR